MTIGEIENLARTILLDTYEDAYRFTPSEIFNAIRDGIERTRSMRPESKYVGGVLKDFEFPIVPASFDSASLTELRGKTIVMEEHWRQALVFYAVYCMYLKDDPDTANQQLASNYYQQYTAAVNA